MSEMRQVETPSGFLSTLAKSVPRLVLRYANGGSERRAPGEYFTALLWTGLSAALETWGIVWRQESDF